MDVPLHVEIEIDPNDLLYQLSGGEFDVVIHDARSCQSALEYYLHRTDRRVFGKITKLCDQVYVERASGPTAQGNYLVSVAAQPENEGAFEEVLAYLDQRLLTKRRPSEEG